MNTVKDHQDTKRIEFNKFAKLCLKDAEYDRETIAYVMHQYRGFELIINKFEFARQCLEYARYITNY